MRARGRFLLGAAAAALFLVNLAGLAQAPIERRGPAAATRPAAPPSTGGAQVSANPNPAGGVMAGNGPRGNGFGGGRGMHLNDWMRAHNDLPLPQQQQALEREPGFRDLPPQTQQRMRDRLSQLSTMPPQQRAKMLERNEAMEKLNPNQRAEVRSAMLQLGALPMDQRRMVSKAFRELRMMPPDQRGPMLNNRYAYMNPQQRQSLQQLMQIEPMLPPLDSTPMQGGGR